MSTTFRDFVVIFRFNFLFLYILPALASEVLHDESVSCFFVVTRILHGRYGSFIEGCIRLFFHFALLAGFLLSKRN